MAAKLTRSIQLHIVTENCTICSSRSRRPVRKLLDTPSYAIHLLNCGVVTGIKIHIYRTMPILTMLY
jgi:hypothetical protein